MYHTCRHTLYRTCTCYSCLPEDKPLGSKLVRVEDIELNLTEVNFVGLHYMIPDILRFPNIM